MKNRFLQICNIIVVACFLLLVTSCATYNSKSQVFQSRIQTGNIKGALAALDKNKFLLKNRNRLLYFFEKGKMAYLDGDYELSNELFNKADAFIEEDKRALGNKIIGVVLNPEKETYKGEDFEKVAIHYYKALNYTFLNKYDDALVEAKRISLQLQKLNDAYPEGKKNRYKEDAFALNLQGLLYEASGDINNAFISYRNSIDVYLKNQGKYIGVSIPEQLKQDLFRTADIMGFRNSVEEYEKKLGVTYNKKSRDKEVIVFWENGLVPYKDETYFTFTLLPGSGLGYGTIINKDLALDLPLPLYIKKDSPIDVFNVAFPRYIRRRPYYNNATIIKEGGQYNFQLAQDYEEIAFKTLKDRTLREIGKTALRIATKKVSQYAVQNKNEELGTILGLFNAFTEGADTRNWQSLPGKIYYSRIPLVEGDNKLKFQLQSSSGRQEEVEMNVKGKKGLQFRKVSSLRVYK